MAYIRGSQTNPRPGRYRPPKPPTPPMSMWVLVPTLVVTVPLSLVAWPILMTVGRWLPEGMQFIIASPIIVLWAVVMSR